jgi:hypothetical protein
MAYGTIDIGAGASNYGSYRNGGYTTVCQTNPANANGVLTSFEVWLSDPGGGSAKMGSFSGSDSNYTMRDYETLGSVTANSKQTFTGKNCDVSSGDYIGYYNAAGTLRVENTGGSGNYWYNGDGFTTPCSYNHDSNYKNALYATGVTIPDAPTDVSATDNLTDKVTITWTAGTGETGGHRVYRDRVDISGVVAHGTATYDDTTAVAGTT